MAAIRPSSRYSSIDSSPSSSSSSSSALHRLPAPTSSGRRGPAPAAENPTRALALARTTPDKAKAGHSFGAMVKKLMEKRSGSKPGSAARTPAVIIPADPIAEELKRSKKPTLPALHRKLFPKGGSTERPGAAKALTEVKPNTRTLAMVLRSERELMAQNKLYGDEISELRLLVEEKNREVEKLKDLCLKQRQEIKALKDAVLFPDVMNSQLHELLERQGSELKQAKQVIPSLQKQVSSLTGQLHYLAEGLAEVKADKYAVRTCFDGHINSPQTPIYFEEASDSLEYSCGDPVTSVRGTPDDMFLKDLNPCLTPRFVKMNSKEYDEMLDYESLNKVSSCQRDSKLSPDMSLSSRVGTLSKSSEYCQRPSLTSTAKKINKSDEKKWSGRNLTIRNFSDL